MRKRGDGFRLVTQYEHGALAGELAERWGNDRFAMPAEPFAAALMIAAAHHDDGWRELDDLPAHNPEAGRPAHFLELPLERTVPPYGRGVDSVYARDPLAGALVHAHWTGLYSGRWGLQSSGGPVPHPLAEEVVAKGEPRRQATLREVWNFEGPRSRFEANAWHAYEVLQALDVTSLALSLLDPSVPSDPALEPPLLTATLFPVEQPPGGRILPSVPTAPLGEHLDLTLSVPAPGVATVDPWPFAEPSFALELPARSLAGDGLAEDEARAAYQAAPVEPIRWTLSRESGR
ncbi:MAG TPA: DUF3891 family protein [Solirubrobacterales bacterium]|nr:DUF3891 family protein [Solirubrobacterales bacterium]